MSWIQTYTGKRFDLVHPHPADVDLRDIAHALSHLCRFGGHTNRFYSVAQHSVMVSRLVDPRFALHGLLHDAGEAYTGDVVRPLKEILNRISRNDYELLAATLDDAIARRFGLTWTNEAVEAVGKADEIALATEARDLLGPAVENWTARLLPPSDERVIPWLSPDAARLRFTTRYIELTVPESKRREMMEALQFHLAESDAGERFRPAETTSGKPEAASTAATGSDGGPGAETPPSSATSAADKSRASAGPAVASASGPPAAPVIVDDRPLSKLSHEIRLEILAANVTATDLRSIRLEVSRLYGRGEIPNPEASHLQELVAAQFKRLNAEAIA